MGRARSDRRASTKVAKPASAEISSSHVPGACPHRRRGDKLRNQEPEGLRLGLFGRQGACALAWTKPELPTTARLASAEVQGCARAVRCAAGRASYLRRGAARLGAATGIAARCLAERARVCAIAVRARVRARCSKCRLKRARLAWQHRSANPLLPTLAAPSCASVLPAALQANGKRVF